MLLQWIQITQFSLRGQIKSRYLATEQVVCWESLFLLSLLFVKNDAELTGPSGTLSQWTDLPEMSCETEMREIIFIFKSYICNYSSDSIF